MRRRDCLLSALMPVPVPARRGAIRLHAGNYGLQSLPVERALDEIRRIGYDGAELCLLPGWKSEPAQLDAAARRRIRVMGFPVPTMMDGFNALAAEPDQARTLDRIRAAAALAHDIAPEQPPILQTVLGGKPGDWEQMKEQMARRLAEWAAVARENRIRLAVKSHIGSACNTPEKLIWLLDRVRDPALSANYDYSHFQLLDLGLQPTLAALLPRSSFLTVKDGHMVTGNPRFLLPGDGTIDYRQYFSILRQKSYRGWMLGEISRQLQIQPGYDGIAAARRSYGNLAPLLRDANLR